MCRARSSFMNVLLIEEVLLYYPSDLNMAYIQSAMWSLPPSFEWTRSWNLPCSTSSPAYFILACFSLRTRSIAFLSLGHFIEEFSKLQHDCLIKYPRECSTHLIHVEVPLIIALWISSPAFVGVTESSKYSSLSLSFFSNSQTPWWLVPSA